MAYTDKTYFLTKIKESELDNLIRDTDGTAQEDYLTEAIKSSDNLIDSYLRNAVNDLPLDPVPDMVKQLSYFIALYFLNDRNQYADIPQRVKDNYDAAINFLKDISTGKATLEGIEEEDLDNFIDYEVNTNVFNRQTF